MSGTVDSLNIKIDASAKGANRQLDTLVQKMIELRSTVNGINVGNLNNLATSMQNFSKAASGLNQVKTTDFTRMAKCIEKLSQINKNELNEAAKAIGNISKAFSNMGNVSDGANKIAQLAQGISRLGYKSTTQAIQNIPLLTTELKNMMSELSKAPAVSDNIIAMTNAMANLGAQASGIRSVGSAMNSAGRSGNGFFGIMKRGISNVWKFASSVRSATNHNRSFASTIGLLYAKFWALKRATGKLGDAIKSSMDYIEEYNYFNTTMEKIASEWNKDFKQFGYESADSYGKSFEDRMTEIMNKMTGFQMNRDGTLTDSGVKNLGLDVTQMTNYAASVAQVTNSVGLTGEASLATSKALSMLAGDMSSFRNLDMETVMNNFSSGLIGQSRALYKYGIDITNATLATYAHELGINKDISAMTQSEKMQLRMIAILDQSKVAWGDLAKTINSPSNQLRLLDNNFKALSRTVGNIFLPVVAKVLPYVNGLVIAIRRLFEWTASMLGIDLKDVIGNSGGGYSDAFDNLGDDADNASSSIGKVADSTDKATDAQKKLNKQLQVFDKLNNMTTSTTKGSSSSDKGNGSGGDPIDLTGQLNSALADYEKVWNDEYKKMTNDAEKFADKLTKLFKSAWTSGDGSDIGSAVAEWLNKGINWVNSHTDNFEKGCKKIANILATSVNGFVEKLKWDGLGKAIGNSMKAVIEAETHFFDKVDWVNLGKGIATTLNSWIDTGVIQSYLNNTASKLRAAIELAFGAITTFKFDKLGKAIGQGINDFFDDMGKVNPKTKKTGWEELAIDISESIKGIATTITTALGTVKWKKVGQAIANFIGSIDWKGITWKLGNMGGALTDAIGDVIEGITGDDVGIGKSIALGAVTFVISKYTFKKIAASALGAQFLAACGFTSGLSFALPLTIAVAGIAWDFSIFSDINKAAGEESTEKGKSVLRQSVEQMIKDILSGDFKLTLPFGITLPSAKEAVDIVGGWIADKFKTGVVGVLAIGLKIGTAIQDLWEDIKKAWGDLTSTVLNVGVKIATTVSEIIDELSTWWTDVKKFWGDKYVEIKGKISDSAKKIKEWWSNLKEGAKTLWAKAKGTIDKSWESVKKAWGDFKTRVKSVFVKAKGAVDSTWKSVKEAWGKFKEGTKTVLAKAKGSIDNGFKNIGKAWNSFKETTKELWANAKGKIESTWNNVQTAWSDFKEGTKNLFVSADGAIQDGFKTVSSKWADFKEGTKNALIKAKGDIGKSFNIASEKWKAFSENAKKNVKNAILKLLGNPNSSSYKKVKEMYDKFHSKTATLSAKAREIGANIFKKIKKGWNDISSKTATLTATFRDFFTAPLKKAWNAIAGAINKGLKVINKIPAVNIPMIPKLAKGGIFAGGSWHNIA